ncbi:MAG: hypothetical protein HUU21_35185, partial [Polyangiaceae bacterium]|nr:hypothetical protein [Polyangiaceae bacterium]
VVAEPAPAQRADHKLRRSGHAPVSGGVLFIPPSFQSSDGAFDVVMHFHGNTELVEESMEAAKVNALVYIVNLGIGSGAYEDRWSMPGLFDEALDRIRAAVEKRGLREPRLRRVALSSWSAGYGAVSKILEVKKNFERIDALMLLDGLHASFVDEKNRTGADPAKLGPFIRFAKAAAEGKVLFTVTHSEIKTLEYASTRETADVLLRAVGASRSPSSEAPPKVTLPSTVGVVPKDSQQWLAPTTEARLGGLHVRGFTGQTPEHHMAHLIQMSVTVLPELAERWQ